MPELVVFVDGKHVPLRACDWVFFHACGCPRGVSMAEIGDTVLYDEEHAWRDFFDQGTRKRDTDAAIARERKRGVTAQLVSHERYRREIYPLMTAPCPHTLPGT